MAVSCVRLGLGQKHSGSSRSRARSSTRARRRRTRIFDFDFDCDTVTRCARVSHHPAPPFVEQRDTMTNGRKSHFHRCNMASNVEQRLLALEQGLLRVASLEQSHAQIAQLHEMVCTEAADSHFILCGLDPHA